MTNLQLAQAFGEASQIMRELAPDSPHTSAAQTIAAAYWRLTEGFPDAEQPSFTDVTHTIKGVLEVFGGEPEHFELTSQLNDLLPLE